MPFWGAVGESVVLQNKVGLSICREEKSGKQIVYSFARAREGLF